VNGWTGGQYSLLRLALGTTLAVGLAWTGGSIELAGVAFAALLGVGLWHRVAALTLAALWAFLYARGAGIAVAAPMCASLVVHAALPSRPYGSVAGRGQADAGAGWRVPPLIFAAAWVLTTVERCMYSFGALMYGGRWAPLAMALVAIVLSLGRRTRPLAWVTLLAMRLITASSNLGGEFLLALAFDPAWIPSVTGGDPVLFYDGQCGLCHRFVRFALSEDRTGSIAFAPLGGETFLALPEPARADLPDSLVLATRDGIRVRSAAVLELMARMGGLWRVGAWIARAFPARLRDAVYDAVARVRHRLFARPPEACPVVRRELRARFRN
jgi:predicted DCC family thiol-disulfide oxidoreductase YuxK